MKKWKLGMYRRLSADEKVEGESNSVSNQKKLIEYFLNDRPELTIYKSYVDDGYTGTDFNRPGYKEMIKDIEKGKINGVIVKDLSRVGRNYIEVGKFLDEIVPYYNLRFISVNDNVDSYINPGYMNSLEIPLKNLMNESYSRDASKKMRTNLKASKKSGNFIGKIAPFGYLKDSEDYHKLIIDEEAAKIIKNIFYLALKGKSKKQIIKELEINNIPTPSIYLKNKFGISVSKISDKWNVNMVDSILRNEMYKGNLIQGKRTRISHKTHNMVRVAEDEWIIKENTHKEIIKKELFDQVQDLLYGRNIKCNIQGSIYKYAGFVKCSECGCNLYRKKRIKNNKEVYFYYCGTYIKTKKCNKHYITEKELDETVLYTINKYINMICELDEKIEDIVNYSKIDYDEEVKKIRLLEIDKNLETYKNLLEELVKDYQCDFISQEDYLDFKEKYLYEINRLNLEKEEINNRKIKSYDLKWIDNFRMNQKLEKLDRNIIENFIDNIYVYNDKSIDIKFKFKNEYEEALSYLKNEENMV